jgi:hypothetical protein
MYRDCGAGGDPEACGDAFRIDCSDAIDAHFIIEQMARASQGTLVVIDDMQIPGQRRDRLVLTEQVS